jgi:stearoyl-CoA desaturase (delta-9 desaturase)
MTRGETPKQHSDAHSTGLIHKIVLTLWAVGPLIAFPFALHRAVKSRRIGKKVVITTILGYLLTGQGITLGFHRLATHESFKTHGLVKGIILALGSAAAQGPVITWADNHRRHHINADQPGDPHSPHADFGDGWRETVKGFLHSHIFWLFDDKPADFGRFTKRLKEDKVVSFVDRTFAGWVALGLLIPGLIAGWSGFLWGGVIRMLLVNHATFAVNSVCHMFGKRRFNTQDESRNNWFIALLTGGEGNHNNHHANAKAAYHGLTWREYDLTGYVIRALSFVGIAWDVHDPTPAEIEARQAQLDKAAAKLAAKDTRTAPTLLEPVPVHAPVDFNAIPGAEDDAESLEERVAD